MVLSWAGVMGRNHNMPGIIASLPSRGEQCQDGKEARFAQCDWLLLGLEHHYFTERSYECKYVNFFLCESFQNLALRTTSRNYMGTNLKILLGPHNSWRGLNIVHVMQPNVLTKLTAMGTTIYNALRGSIIQLGRIWFYLQCSHQAY